MQALIDFIIRNLLMLWPITRVYTWEQGLLVRNGQILREMGPGLHWRWLFIDEVKKWPSNEIGLDLQSAAITTIDGVSVVVSANVGYRMVSIERMWRTLWASERTFTYLALGVIASHCAKERWQYLQSERADLESRLLAVLNERVGEWGLFVVRVHLTDIVAAKPHRHYLDGMGQHK